MSDLLLLLRFKRAARRGGTFLTFADLSLLEVMK